MRGSESETSTGVYRGSFPEDLKSKRAELPVLMHEAIVANSRHANEILHDILVHGFGRVGHVYFPLALLEVCLIHSHDWLGLAPA